MPVLAPADVGVPIVPTDCPTLLSPLCHAAGSLGATVLGDGIASVLSSLAAAVAGGAAWLLDQVGTVLSATTTVTLSAGWFTSHFAVMGSLAAVVVLPLLLVGVVQAIYRQSAAALLRLALVQLPLAVLFSAVAVQMVQLALTVTDALSAAVASGSGSSVTAALDGLGKVLVASSATGVSSPPSLVVLLGALLVAFGALTLWIELLVRAAAVYVAVLFLPLTLATVVVPSLSHWTRRLFETLAALVLSKFVITAVLSLAAGALASGTATGFAGVLAGGALLLLATFMPFALLRLIPAAEAGAIAHLESVRHRAQQSAVASGRSAAAIALRAAGAASFPEAEAGTGLDLPAEPPGPDAGTPGADSPGAPGGEGSHEGEGPSDSGRAQGQRSGGAGSASTLEGVPFWQGTPPTAGAGSDPPTRGPLPLRGTPVGAEDRLSPPDAPFSRRYVVRHDGLGPVLHLAPRRHDEEGHDG